MSEPTIHCAHDSVIALSDLKPNPANPNTHPEPQIALLAKIIKAQGWRNPIVVSNRSGYIVKGHGRLAAALTLGATHAPIDYQDYASEKQELADMIADNRIAELAELDRSLMRELAEQLDDGAFDMDLTGFDHDALEELMTAAPPDIGIDAEPQIDKAEELRVKWGVERGQRWQLDQHWLCCGDSTNLRDVQSLFDGDLPSHHYSQMMVTDPPYGVKYNAAWRDDALGEANRAIGKVLNDDQADWRDAYKLFTGNIAYVWHAGTKSLIVAEGLASCGLEIRAQIIWVKQHFVIGRGDYHVQHEPCWYVVRKGKKGKWNGDRTQTTTWLIDNRLKQSSNGSGKEITTGHSTQKPTECMARAIRNHTNPVVYDPFVGSGTTIIACEQLKRYCRAMEIDPGYVAVSIQRWADATGKTPKLLSSFPNKGKDAKIAKSRKKR